MKKKHIITLGGLPGGGKSTVKALLEKQMEWNSFSTGDYMRSLAKERGMTFDEFNAHIAENKADDELIDKELQRIETQEDHMIVDSHLAFHFVPSAFKVFLNISLAESAKRIYSDSDRESRKSVGDTMASIDEAEKRIAARIENHNDRYMRHYGISPYEVSQYDLVIDTELHNPEEVVAIILDAYNNWIQ